MGLDELKPETLRLLVKNGIFANKPHFRETFVRLGIVPPKRVVTSVASKTGSWANGDGQVKLLPEGWTLREIPDEEKEFDEDGPVWIMSTEDVEYFFGIEADTLVQTGLEKLSGGRWWVMEVVDLSEALPPSIIPRSQPTHKAYLDFAREKNRFSQAAILGPGAYGM